MQNPLRKYNPSKPVVYKPTFLEAYGKPLLIIGILLLLGFLFGGCQAVADKAGYVPKTKMEQRIAALEQKQAEQVSVAVAKVEKAKDDYLASVLSNFQYTSDWLYGARLGVALLPVKDRLFTVIDYRLKTAASYAPTPSREALATMNDTLKTELDETKTSIKDLEIKYNAKVEEAKKATDAQIQKQNEVVEKESELKDLKEKHRIDIGKLKDEAIITANKQTQDAIAANDEKHQKAIEANKRIIMATCGVLALAALACAIWLPVLKKEAGQFAAITGGVALMVPFLQPIHLNIIYALGLAYVAFRIIRRHMLTEKTNNNLINTIQDVKDTKPDVYKEIQPILAERNTVYVKGNEKKEDTAVVNHIDAVLREYERK